RSRGPHPPRGQPRLPRAGLPRGGRGGRRRRGAVGPRARHRLSRSRQTSPEGTTTMTTTVLQPATASAPRAGRAARVLSLVRAEMLLLVRNRTTLFNAVALAPLTVLFFATLGMTPDSGGAGVAGMLLTMLVALALVIVVYYNLTTTIVARREELVLKRLLTGDVSRGEIIAATAAPAV